MDRAARPGPGEAEDIECRMADDGQPESLGHDGLGYDGLGYDGLGHDGLGYDGLGYDGLGYDGLGYDGLGYDGSGRPLSGDDDGAHEDGCDAIIHPDLWKGVGLAVGTSALSPVSVVRAKTPQDVVLVCAQHNLRQQNEDHRHRFPINDALTHLNAVLEGPDTPLAVNAACWGILLKSGYRHRANAAVAVEVVIRPPDGWDVPAFWAACLEWAGKTYQHVISAIIHRDQRRVHVHIIAAAVVGGTWVGADIAKGKLGAPRITSSVKDYMRAKFGIRADRAPRTFADIMTKPVGHDGLGYDGFKGPVNNSNRHGPQTVSNAQPFHPHFTPVDNSLVHSLPRWTGPSHPGAIVLIPSIRLGVTTEPPTAATRPTHTDADGADFDAINRDTTAEARAALARHAGNRHTSPLAAMEAARAGAGEPAGRTVLTDEEVAAVMRESLTEARLALANDESRKAKDRAAVLTAELQAAREELRAASQALSTARVEIRSQGAELSRARAALAAEVAARGAAETAMQAAVDRAAASASQPVKLPTAAEQQRARCEASGRRGAAELVPRLAGAGWTTVEALRGRRIEGWSRDDKIRSALEALVKSGKAEFRDVGLKAGHRRQYRLTVAVEVPQATVAVNPFLAAQDDELAGVLAGCEWGTIPRFMERRITGWTGGSKLRGGLNRLVAAGRAERREGRDARGQLVAQ